MTNCTSRSHESSTWFESSEIPGVRYQVARISLDRRISLARQIREASRTMEFLEASGDIREHLDAAVLQGELERVYLEWGLLAVEGLQIDEKPATRESLVERGPLPLAMEIVRSIRKECGLTESERKN